ncbi:MAG: sulfite exporter TauE/SafE family protein, partial [Solirubrobacterales bacterium]|nr:sulfite exporter TauE/SafE family protein [Solirubrobacterales bacterium]
TVTTRSGGADGFAGVFEAAAAGTATLAFLLLAALGWGALHALSPGHGKAMVAAYLVGTRGRSRHAVALGAIVTVTHTIGVFALGLVTLLLAQYVLPEDLYPWLTLASGLLVVAIGVAVLRARVGRHRSRRTHHHEHAHGRDHHHDHEQHDHRHDIPDAITWKGLTALGASAGLIPCPSALVVLLGAVAQHQVALGLVLILAFSVGLAATLTALGLLVVHGGRLATRLRLPHSLVTGLPAASALVIVTLGCLLTLQAVPKLL